MKIKNEFIDDIMVTALEGGINYWCNKVTIVNREKWNGQIASDIISQGGSLIINTVDGERKPLTKKNFTKGFEKAMEHYEYTDVEDFIDDHDAEFADVIIQFAIFDEIVYG